jgi:adenosylhomocysteine nucleosidase
VRLGFLAGLTAEIALLKHTGHLAEAGGGTPAGATAAVQRLIGQGATAIISFGLAGGLRPGLAPGTLIIPTVILDGADRRATDPALNAALRGATGHIITGAAAIVATAADKAALHAATGADAVDLESVAACRAGLPFAALRAIADPAERDLPTAALTALTPSGGIDLPRILLNVLRNPAQIPALISVGMDTKRAKTTLTAQLTKIAFSAET